MKTLQLSWEYMVLHGCNIATAVASRGLAKARGPGEGRVHEAESATYLEAADNEAPGAHSRQLRAASSNCAAGHGLVGEHHLFCWCWLRSCWTTGVLQVSKNA
jgi:hypothetical protein